VSTANPRLAWALYLAGRGWPVLPLTPGRKYPFMPDWEARATTDPDTITRFWTTYYDHNIGIACGPAGLVVVDLDLPKPRHAALSSGSIRRGVECGAQVLADLAEQADAAVPDTWTVKTPSGGTHLYFLPPTGVRLYNTHHKLGWLIDTRAWGGQVVAPGSTTSTGTYELISDHNPVELPAWLYQLLTERPPTTSTAPNRIDARNITRWVQAAVAGEQQRLATAPEGAHNQAQQIAGRALGELVGGHHLDYHDALQRMEQAAQPHITGPCRCTARSVRRVLESSLRYGIQRPRSLPSHTRQDGAA
jgi:hypothetical protein